MPNFLCCWGCQLASEWTILHTFSVKLEYPANSCTVLLYCLAEITSNPIYNPSFIPIYFRAQQQQQCSNQKRARTRITDDQLKILRAHFDINNSPSEESIMEMSHKANLPMKVRDYQRSASVGFENNQLLKYLTYRLLSTGFAIRCSRKDSATRTRHTTSITHHRLH